MKPHLSYHIAHIAHHIIRATHDLSGTLCYESMQRNEIKLPTVKREKKSMQIE